LCRASGGRFGSRSERRGREPDREHDDCEQKENTMMASMDTWFVSVAQSGFGVLLVAMVLVFVRLLRGPTLADRVVALDMIAFLAIGVVALYAVLTGQPAFLDAALVLALIAFMATVAFARFVERTSGNAERGR
jgi:multicomponent Na+:H+ antiporter subunit F